MSMLLIPLNTTTLLNHSQLSKDDPTSACIKPPSTSRCLRNCHPDRLIFRGCVPVYAFSQGIINRVSLKWEHHCQTYPLIFLHLASASHHSCLNQSFACRLIFFPLIPDPTHWQPFMRLKDKEDLLLRTCFSTALRRGFKSL